MDLPSEADIISSGGRVDGCVNPSTHLMGGIQTRSEFNLRGLSSCVGNLDAKFP